VKTVLLVEDDTFYAGRLKELLTDLGYSVECAASTQDALQFSDQVFNWAIIDVMLPNDEKISGISSMESRGGYLSGLALARKMIQKRFEGAIVMLSGVEIQGEVQEWAEDNKVPLITKFEGRAAMKASLAFAGMIEDEKPSSFIVHGHDDSTLYELQNFIQNSLGWKKPVILRDEASGGRTIIEKFEWFATRVDWVFVLFTPDDRVLTKEASNEDKRRARQNVIFEMGYFYGKLDRLRGRVIALVNGELELPSDIAGVVYIPIDKGLKSAAEDIRREIRRVRPDLIMS
jgi:predicted nucleotide-binding protein